MDPGLAAVLAASVGALSALLGTWLAGARQSGIEARRLAFEREETINGEAREVVRELIATMASATHSMCWLTWLADVAPQRITEERLEQYDSELHALLPRLMGLQAKLSTYHNEAASRVASTILEIEKLDAEIGEAAHRFSPGGSGQIQALTKAYRTAYSLHHKLRRLAPVLELPAALEHIEDAGRDLARRSLPRKD